MSKVSGLYVIGGTPCDYATRRSNTEYNKERSFSRKINSTNPNEKFGKNHRTPAELNQPGTNSNKPNVRATTPLAHQGSTKMTLSIDSSKNLNRKHVGTKRKTQFGRKDIKLEIINFNCQGLASEGRVLELEHALDNLKFDILGLSEIRREGESIVKRKNGNILFYYGNTKGHKGVGFYIHKRCVKNVTEIRGISERIALIKIKLSDTTKMVVIQVYAPTSAAPKDEVKLFYSTLEECLESIKEKHIFIMGDFNAKVGSETEVGPCTGLFSTGKTNKNGYNLAKFCMKYNLKVGNTYFEYPESDRWTWKSPDGTTKNEIDHILTLDPHLISTP